jgi:hypothetical protein
MKTPSPKKNAGARATPVHGALAECTNELRGEKRANDELAGAIRKAAHARNHVSENNYTGGIVSFEK